MHLSDTHSHTVTDGQTQTDRPRWLAGMVYNYRPLTLYSLESDAAYNNMTVATVTIELKWLN